MLLYNMHGILVKVDEKDRHQYNNGEDYRFVSGFYEDIIKYINNNNYNNKLEDSILGVYHRELGITVTFKIKNNDVFLGIYDNKVKKVSQLIDFKLIKLLDEVLFKESEFRNNKDADKKSDFTSNPEFANYIGRVNYICNRVNEQNKNEPVYIAWNNEMNSKHFEIHHEICSNIRSQDPNDRQLFIDYNNNVARFIEMNGDDLIYHITDEYIDIEL